MKTLDNIKESYKNGYYSPKIYHADIWPESKVIDENLTIKANHEQIEEHNKSELAKQHLSRENYYARQNELTNDCIEAISNEYNVPISVATMIHQFAYDAKHSYFIEYFDYAYEIADLVKDVIEEYKKTK